MHAETKKKIQQGGAICRECAVENGAVSTDSLGCTGWTGECIVCEKEKSCCCTSDWNWPFWKPNVWEREI